MSTTAAAAPAKITRGRLRARLPARGAGLTEAPRRATLAPDLVETRVRRPSRTDRSRRAPATTSEERGLGADGLRPSRREARVDGERRSMGTSTRATSRARSGGCTSRPSGRGAAIARSSFSQSSSDRRGTLGCRRAFTSPSSIVARTRPNALSPHSSRNREMTSAAPARGSSPCPMTKVGRPPSVSHHTPVCTASALSPSSSSPRSRLTTSVLHSPDDNAESAAVRRTRNPRTRSVHHGSSASWPSARRMTSTGPATCSAPANRHPTHPASEAASTRTATPSPRVTSVPANGPSVGSSARTTRCAPGRSAVPRSSISTSAIPPSQPTGARRETDRGRCGWIRDIPTNVEEESSAPLGANSTSRHPRTG